MADAHRRPRRISQDRILSLLMITPTLIAIAIFVYGFIGWTGYMSMSAWEGIRPDYTFVGFDNYISIFNTGRFQTNLRNTIVFTSFFLVGCLGLGLALALLVDACRNRISEAVFRTIYLFPMALSLIVTGVAWRWIFTPGTIPTDPTGINLLFQHIGLGFLQSPWITDSTVVPGIRPEGLRTRLGIPFAMIPIIVAAVWQMSGFTMAMYLAGLRGIPHEIREAARVDGANEWQLFRLVILPQLRPITLSAVIILGHISLKIFDLVVTMTGGGPGNATEVPGVYMYEIAFKANKFAEGAAVAMVMLVLVALLIIPYLVYNQPED
ncbi:MAG: sugar ABC transporter permease [Chloroflexaceae bacterium]|nr:sugar ABC transporter permease [Chloroflexaceae bacterium]